MEVLIYAPGGRNGAVLEKHLTQAKVANHLCASEQVFLEQLEQNPNVILITQRAWTKRVAKAFEAFSKRQANWSSPPVLFLAESNRHVFAISGAYYIKKPVPFATLLSAVQLALEAREQQLEVAKLLTHLEAHNLSLTDKVAEQGASLEVSELRFERVFRANPTPTAIIDRETGKFIDVNPSFEELTNYDQKALLGKKPERLNMIVDKRPWKHIFSEDVHGDERFEMRLRTQTGLLRYCLLNAEPIEDGGTHLLVTLVDISEQKQGEEHLLRAVDEVMQDASWFSRAVVERVSQLKGETMAHLPSPDLTRREEQVLGLIGQGLANKDIAAKLELSPNTVRNYIKNLYSKIDVSSRSEAVIWARERGISFVDT